MPYASHAAYGLRTIQVAGLPFADISHAECVDLIVNERLQGRGGWMVTANTDFLRMAHDDPEVRSLYQKADVVVADGMPVIWASRLQGTPLKRGRICGSDLIFSLPEASARAGLSIFLLGGVDDIAERTEAVLCQRYPGLRIAGRYSPPFGFEKQAEQYAAMRAALQEARPDIVFVALGAPKSERLIQELRASAPDAWWMGVGASFEFACGARSRAPRLLQRLGAEWLYRMLQDPKRLVRRYLQHDLLFLPVLIASAVRTRMFGRPAVPSATPASTSGA